MKLSYSLFAMQRTYSPTILLFPFVTTRIFKMSAPSSESPAVMKSPNNRSVDRAEILKQQRVVQPMVVDVVEMDHIRLPLFDSSDQLARRSATAESLAVKQTVLSIMKVSIRFATHPYKFRLRSIAISPEGNSAFPPPLDGHGTYPLGNLPGGPPVGRYIKLQ